MERFTTCKVELDLFDTTAKEDSSLASSNVQPFADIENIKQQNLIKKVATLESDYFLLDGTFNFYDDLVSTQSIEIPQNEGYMSSEFQTEINISFTKNHSSAGLTFHFWEALPKSITIRAKNGKSVLAIETFYPTEKNSEKVVTTEIEVLDALRHTFTHTDYHRHKQRINEIMIDYTYFADFPVENYDGLNIIIEGGDRFVRINYIEYGVKLLYGENDNMKLKSCTLTEEADVLSTELSINESTVEVIDMENLFKVTNPSSYYRYLQQRQVFKITEIIDDEEKFMANHYLKEWSQTKEHSATFKLQDILGLMSDTTFYGGLYVDKKAGDLFAEIFNDYGLEDYEIDEDIKDIKLTGYLATMTHREALQQVAFACGACVTTSRITGVKIFKAIYEALGYIDSDRKLLSNSETTQDSLITEIDLTSHNYVLNSEEKEVYSGDFEPGTYIVTFSNPSTNLNITGGTILNSDVNYAQIKVDEEGEVTINGQEYEDHTFVHKYTELEELPSATSVNITEVTNATLISKSNVNDVAELLYYIKQYRLEHKCKIITQEEEVANMYALKVIDEFAPLLITKLETDLTGGFISTCEGIGYALKIIDYYRAGSELYTGEEGII